MMFGGVFTLSGILHLYYNRKPFKHYLMERIRGQLRDSGIHADGGETLRKPAKTMS